MLFPVRYESPGLQALEISPQEQHGGFLFSVVTFEGLAPILFHCIGFDCKAKSGLWMKIHPLLHQHGLE